MSVEKVASPDTRIQAVVTEIQGLITVHYPEATFEVVRGEDPEGTYLIATVDTDDLTAVLGIVEDRVVDIQINQGLPLCVVPVRPLERVLHELRQPTPRARPRIDLEATSTPVRA